MANKTPDRLKPGIDFNISSSSSVIQQENIQALVSIIVGVYNCENYVTAAIESILAQTYRPIEVIIINDGSKDATAERLLTFGSKIQIIEQTNQGQSAALNTGLAHASGKYIGFLDADDLWTSKKLAIQVRYLETHPQISLVFSYVQQFISPELDEKARQTLICPKIPDPGFVKITMLARRQVFEQVGLFNINIRIGEFVDWFMRAHDAGLETHLLPDVLALRRLHKTHTTSHTSEALKSYVHVLKAGLDRRRNLGTDKSNPESKTGQ